VDAIRPHKFGYRGGVRPVVPGVSVMMYVTPLYIIPSFLAYKIVPVYAPRQLTGGAGFPVGPVTPVLPVAPVLRVAPSAP
jgi:hypothetical protein